MKNTEGDHEVKFAIINISLTSKTHLSKMKKFILFMFSCLILAVTGTVISCNRIAGVTNTNIVDSADVVSIHNSLENPEFNSVEEVLIFQDMYKRRQVEDSIFAHMDPPTLETIARVVINKEGCATRASILLEWQTNAKRVYNYIGDNKKPEPKERAEIDDTIFTQAD